MSIQGEIVEEGLVQSLCCKLEKKLEKYPEAAKALKEVGIEMLDSLPAIPKWAWAYYHLFRE